MSSLDKAFVALVWGVLFVSAGFLIAGHRWPIYVLVVIVIAGGVSRFRRRQRVAEDA